jgi:RNA polymerase sigma-70 factor, ECF subfamily
LKTDDSRAEDAALIARISVQDHKEEAYGRLVAKYWRLLIAWVRLHIRNTSEAEDIVQETFIRAFRALAHLKEPLRFSGWLLAIARNQSADHTRRRPSMQSLEGLAEETDIGDLLPARGEDAGNRLDQAEEHQAVIRAVDQLPEKYRLVVMLRYFEGLSGGEISTILAEPEGTIRNRLFRAHQKIRRIVREAPPSVVRKPNIEDRTPILVRPSESLKPQAPGRKPIRHD